MDCARGSEAAADRMRLIDAVGDFADPDSLASPVAGGAAARTCCAPSRPSCGPASSAPTRPSARRRSPGKAAEAERDGLVRGAACLRRRPAGDRAAGAARRRTPPGEVRRGSAAGWTRRLRSIGRGRPRRGSSPPWRRSAASRWPTRTRRRGPRDAYAEAKGGRSRPRPRSPRSRPSVAAGRGRSGQHPGGAARVTRAAGPGGRARGRGAAVRRRTDRGAHRVRAVAGGVQPGPGRVRDHAADRRRQLPRFRTAINAVRTPVRLRLRGRPHRVAGDAAARRPARCRGGSTTGRGRSPAGCRIGWLNGSTSCASTGWRISGAILGLSHSPGNWLSSRVARTADTAAPTCWASPTSVGSSTSPQQIDDARVRLVDAIGRRRGGPRRPGRRRRARRRLRRDRRPDLGAGRRRGAGGGAATGGRRSSTR